MIRCSLKIPRNPEDGCHVSRSGKSPTPTANKQSSARMVDVSTSFSNATRKPIHELPVKFSGTTTTNTNGYFTRIAMDFGLITWPKVLVSTSSPWRNGDVMTFQNKVTLLHYIGQQGFMGVPERLRT